jgi:hypothetical protein
MGTKQIYLALTKLHGTFGVGLGLQLVQLEFLPLR